MKADRKHTAEIAASIAARLAALKLSEAAACRAAGLGEDAIRNIKRGHMPSADKAAALARVLGVADLATLAPAVPAPPPIADQGMVSNDVVRLFRNRGGARGAQDELVATVPRPPDLVGRAAGYAVYVDDDRNAPWVRIGHIAFVDPSRPAATGAMVRVFPVTGAPFLGVLTSRAGGRLAVTVAAAAHPIDMAESEVARMERVVGFTLLDG